MKYDEEEHHEGICHSVSLLPAGNSGAGGKCRRSGEDKTEQEEDHGQSWQDQKAEGEEPQKQKGQMEDQQQEGRED